MFQMECDPFNSDDSVCDPDYQPKATSMEMEEDGM